MKTFVTSMLILLVIIILSGCGAGATQLIMQEPEEGKCIVVGAILVENNGVDEIYRAISSTITAIVVGKHTNNEGEEIVEGYRLRTDDNGYFFLPNVPQGAYVLKGIEVSLGYKGVTMITSRWDGARQIYLTSGSDRMIDYVVRSWPEELSGCVHDMGINYFMIDPSMGIYANRYAEIRDKNLALENINHTMANPENYYREKYPDIKCFTE